MSSDKPNVRSGLVFALVGPAGSGKTSLGLKLIEEFKGSIELSVSATTRAPRPGEVDGVNRHFLSREQFQQKIANGELFEWEEVHGDGNLYGQLNSTLESTIHAGIDLLLDIDIRGALKFKERLRNNTVITFIVPPTIEDLRNRIRGRSPVDTQEINTRLATAAVEYSKFLDLARKGDVIDYLVVNDQYDLAYAEVRGQLLAERSRVSRFETSYLEKVCSIK